METNQHKLISQRISGEGISFKARDGTGGQERDLFLLDKIVLMKAPETERSVLLRSLASDPLSSASSTSRLRSGVVLPLVALKLYACIDLRFE